MAAPAALRAALRTRLQSINGVQVYSRWPGQINFPAIIVGRGEAEPEQTLGLGTLTAWRFDLSVFGEPAAKIEQAQDLLDPLFAVSSSTGCVFGALAADRTLAGTAHSTFVRRIGEDSQFDISETLSVLGAIVEVEVWA